MPQEAGKEQGKLKDAPRWMWAIGVLGLVLVLGSIGFMLYEAAAGDSSPPNVTVQLDSVRPTQTGFLIEFRAINKGGTTAQGLTIEGELKNGSETLEISDTTIEYVPSHSERAGGLLFKSDPRLYQLQLRAKGFEKP